MEAVIFTGIQAAGKSTFYKARFFNTHVRINLDMLRTRRRESLLLRACIEGKQPFVVDNTNLTVAFRAMYIAPAREAGFRVVGYYMQSNLGEAIRRNSLREGKAQVPVKALIGASRKLQIPTLEEGFDALYYVQADGTGGFVVEDVAA